MFIRRGSAVSAAIATAIATFSPALYADAQSIAEFAIPAQPLSTALIDLSKQANIQILTAGSAVDGVLAPAVSGRLTLEAALHRLLKDSEFEYRFVDKNTLVLSPKKAQAAATLMRTAQLVEGSEASASSVAQPSASESASSADAASERRVMLEEVIVTGSHIRGAQNLSSPILQIDRLEIERSGYATTQEVVQSLPQNLNNISDSTVAGWSGGGGVGIYQAYDGSGINLRGLGGEATLLLLNGRRLSAAGNGSFVDLSLIPLGAVERVEVLTDGASALYGSDAVGGVVNLVLRKDFEGAETRLRYGTVTEGSLRELQAGQMLGHSWGSGHAIVSYEYFDRGELTGNERDFIDVTRALGNMVLIPEQERHGALAVIEQRLSDRMTFSSDLFYGRRKSYSGYSTEALDSDMDTSMEQIGGTLGLRVDLARDWQLRMTGLFDQNDSELRQRFSIMPGQTFLVGTESRLGSVDVAADGALLSAPGGEVRLAIGGQARWEKFVDQDFDFPATLDRDLAALYAEVHIPWVGDRNRRTGIEHLELTAAARYEEYSDFGSTFNPKIGLAWAPVRGLNVRGTWGTSFKAPLLAQLNPNLMYAQIIAGSLVTPSGLATGLFLTGNGDDLGPEDSKNWTVGFDLQPESLPHLSISATYFDIDYDNRISTPFPTGFTSSEVLLHPIYDDIVVTRNPTRAHVEGLIASAPNASCGDVTTGTPCEIEDHLDDVVAVVDSRSRNLAGVRMSGIDLTVSYRLASPIGDWGFKLSGSQLLDSRRQLVPRAPATIEMNNVWRPTDFRLRNSVSYSHSGVDVVATLSYVDGYRDNRTADWVGDDPQRSTVASWTTVDLTLQYELSRLWTNLSSNVMLQLSGLNIFDRDPPYIAHAMGIHYDGANANPRGRFVGAQFVARW